MNEAMEQATHIVATGAEGELAANKLLPLV